MTLQELGTLAQINANVTMIVEDVPVSGNRVDLDPSVRDVYGRPVARVTYARHPRDQAVVDRYMPKLEEIARERGRSVETVKVQLQKIYRKLGVNSCEEAVEAARRAFHPACLPCGPRRKIRRASVP